MLKMFKIKPAERLVAVVAFVVIATLNALVVAQ